MESGGATAIVPCSDDRHQGRKDKAQDVVGNGMQCVGHGGARAGVRWGVNDTCALFNRINVSPSGSAEQVLAASVVRVSVHLPFQSSRTT